MRVTLDVNQCKGLASALYGAANIFLASVVISQTMAVSPFRPRLFIIGLGMMILLYSIATWLNKERQKEKAEEATR